MRGEHVITLHELQTRFRGERDLVTYAPYAVGDRVVRCGCCRAIVKSEFIVSNACPLCGHSPFTAAPFTGGSHASVRASRTQRSIRTFTWLLMFSALLSVFPFLFEAARVFLSTAAFGFDCKWLYIISFVMSSLIALILRIDKRCKRCWQNSKAGWLLPFIPVSFPYAVLCSVRIVILVLQIALVVLAVGIIAMIVIGLCGGFDS